MLKLSHVISCLLIASTSVMGGEDDSLSTTQQAKPVVKPIPAFTGKVTKSKVRLRASATLDAPIIRELGPDDLLLVTGESDEFYAVQPPADTKGYVFRTYVLDNKVEGNRVNIRLAPNTEAPVIGQLNSGEEVRGTISSANNKWLEISPPATVRFFVAKEYIDRVGDAQFLPRLAKRKEEVNALLLSTVTAGQSELQKPFPDMQIDRVVANYKKIVQDYNDFPDQSKRAKELLDELQDTYLHRKVAYLEKKARETAQGTQNTPAAGTVAKGKPQPAPLDPAAFPTIPHPPIAQEERLAAYLPQELTLFDTWAETHTGDIDDFYSDQRQKATTIVGELQPYGRQIKNKPGDYVLLSRATNQPIAFLYSTKVDLIDRVGEEVSVEVVPRPHNHFAYPAYFVLSIR